MYGKVEQLKLHFSLCREKPVEKEEFSAWLSYSEFSFLSQLKKTKAQIEFEIERLAGVDEVKAVFISARLCSLWHILHFK